MSAKDIGVILPGDNSNSETKKAVERILGSLYEKYQFTNVNNNNNNARLGVIGASRSQARILKFFTSQRDLNQLKNTIATLPKPSNLSAYFSNALDEQAGQLFSGSSGNTKEGTKVLYVFVDKIARPGENHRAIANLKRDGVTLVFVALNFDVYSTFKQNFDGDKIILVDGMGTDDDLNDKVKKLLKAAQPGNFSSCLFSIIYCSGIRLPECDALFENSQLRLVTLDLYNSIQ